MLFELGGLLLQEGKSREAIGRYQDLRMISGLVGNYLYEIRGRPHIFYGLALVNSHAMGFNLFYQPMVEFIAAHNSKYWISKKTKGKILIDKAGLMNLKVFRLNI